MPEIVLITDRALVPMSRVWGFLPEAAGAGLTGLMLREKDLPGGPMLALAREAVARCRPLGVEMIVNDRVDVALAAHADGVHLGVASLPVREARRIAGRKLRIGASTHTLGELRAAGAGGADYVTFGPVFETLSKAAYRPPKGVEALRDAAAAAVLPVLALGGVRPENAPMLAGTGVAGVAVIGAVLLSEHPVDAIRSLASALGGQSR